MQTHKYHFPAFGDLGNKDNEKDYKKLFEKHLNDSPECLGSWCMFPTDSAILNHVEFEENEKGTITGVNLHTYTQLWKGRENDLRQCVEENLALTSQEYFPGEPNGILIEGDAEYFGRVSDIQTYKYQFPASGQGNAPTFTATMLEKKLKDGPDCLMAYCMFPTDSDILDQVTVDTDEKGNVTALNLHTYTQLWDGMESDLRDCVESNLAAVMEENYKARDCIKIEGDVKALGHEGSIPTTLYHIAEKKDLNNIMRKGLIPSTGDNNYKNTEDMVYLTTEKDIAPWLAILKHKDDPVILEINTAGLNGIETGRVFNDRDFTQGVYTEYRTTESIPASAISEVEIDRGYSRFSEGLRSRMIDMLEAAESNDEFNEVVTGLNRLKAMGIAQETDGQHIIEDRTTNNKTMSVTVGIEEDEGLPWDENDAGIDPNEEWDEKVVGDDLTKALGQMTLEDFGVKI